MKKLLLLLLIGILLLVSACSDNSSNASGDGSVKLSIAHIFPNTHPGGIYLDKLAERLEEETEGKVTLQVNHNAVLGSEAEEMEQMQAGNLDMALLYGSSNFQNFDPAFGVEELPFIFSDVEHARNAHDGAYGDKVKEMAKEYNFEVISFWENGFRHFTNNKKPIVEPSDMSGIKFRSAEIPLRLEMFKLLDANAISMGFDELFTGLQQGTVDGQENPLATIDASKFYEVQDYLSISGHIYNSAPLTISTNSLSKLSEDQQEILFSLAEELKIEQQKTLDDQNQELEQKLADAGMEINEVNRDAFVEAVQPLWKSFAEKNGDELMNLIIDAE
ncbi:DctP family TRAP transporter solute-binding subunit [Chryseomicrobium aureum]|uniref:DctP family TRAP transporter solute-binding subunit n=1 Tax=Chryseomicrobium aureum TaxID=1441723 RepID=UPI00370D4FED